MAKPQKWYDMKAGANEAADIYIYNEIGFFGITASQFIADLMGFGNPKTLNIHLNSVGGDVFDGVAIYNTLLQHAAKKNIIIEGVAASIASVIAMAGDKVSMFETAMFMVHKPWTFAVGTDRDMEKSADILKKLKETIVRAYMSKAKDLSEKDINDLIDEESWMLAEEAKEWGFVDEIIKRNDEEKVSDKADIDARIVDCRDMVERFKNVPQRIAALVRSAPPVAKEKTEIEKENAELKTNLDSANKTINLLTL